ncbi:MAG: MFS transporter [Acidobacteria bacterium]|nr:MFS transporter [Acidobacteriota bacterium]
MRTPPEMAAVALEAPQEIAASRAPALAPAPGANKRLALLSVGHFCIDMYSAALGALQPLLITRYSLSLFEAGILGGVLYFSSSVMQPFYGYLSDRFHFRGFTVLAPMVAGIFISSLGLATGFPMLLLLVFLGGVGVASFHPQGTAHAAASWRHRRGLAMAIFITAGTIGLSAGPAYFSLLTSRLGIERAYWGALPALAITVVLAFTLPPPPRREHAGGPHFDLAPFRRVWKPMLLLYFLVVIRSIVQIVFTQFLPLYFHLHHGFSISSASYVLSFFLLVGAVVGFLGGSLADRFGGKRIVVFSMVASVPFLVLFLLSRGWASLAGLGVGGSILLFTIPVNVTMAQELVPSQSGTVSALMMGFAWGMAGLMFIPLFGWVADHVGLHATLWGVILLPLVGSLLAVKLPADHPRFVRRVSAG